MDDLTSSIIEAKKLLEEMNNIPIEGRHWWYGGCCFYIDKDRHINFELEDDTYQRLTHKQLEELVISMIN